MTNLQGKLVRATLRLYANSASKHGYAIRAVAPTRWHDRTISYANAPALVGPVVGVSGAFGRDTWTSVDVTSFVRSRLTNIATGSATVTFAVTAPAEPAISIASLESSHPPQLVIRQLRVTTRPPTPGTVTAPTTGSSDPVIAAAGDIACDPASSDFNGGSGGKFNCHEQATSNILVSAELAAVLPLGDTQYEDGAYESFLASYAPSWGRLKPISHPVVGNHEYEHGSHAAGYFQYFGTAAGDPSKGYYSYDIGSWHLIALNAECAGAGGCERGTPQERWLRADLAAHHNVCTLAYWHQPRFSSGEHGNDTHYDSFWRDLYAAQADVVLNGHDHIYERFAPQDPDAQANPSGIREFIVGTGGKNHTSINSVQPNSEVRNTDTYGVLELTLHPDGYDWRFVPEQGRSFTDAGSDSCH